MQRYLEVVIEQYKKAQWRIPDTVVIKQMNQKGLELLKNAGVRIPNMINNGVDHIYTTCDHMDLTDEQRKQYIAHEVAHQVLKNHKWVNPHWYLSQYTSFPSQVAGIVLPMYCIPIGLVAIKSDIRLARGHLGVGILMLMHAILVKSLWKSAKDSWRFKERYTKDNIEYVSLGIEFTSPWVKKVEEVVCDVIAASVMPDGGKHGASLWQKRLEDSGDSNGIDGDHPWLSNRVKYHKLIQWFQEDSVQDHT